MSEAIQEHGYSVNYQVRVPAFVANPSISVHVRMIQENPLWWKVARPSLNERLHPQK